MLNEIFKNYEAFYNMVLSTTIMSNSSIPEFEKDSNAIITFIGKSYNLSDELITESSKIILNELSRIRRTTDMQAAYSVIAQRTEQTDIDSLIDIKCEVLNTLIQLSKDKPTGLLNPLWFDYNHSITYQADVRFNKILLSSAGGNIIATRQTGILYSLGIGCKKDYDKAIERLVQCAYWGDLPSIFYLSCVYGLKGDKANAKLFKEISELCSKNLRSGKSIVSDEEKAIYSEKACMNYTYISSIFLDVVVAQNKSDIDFSFIEAILSDSLDHFQRLYYINNYEQRSWREITNSSRKPLNALGFK